jgi:hypothetical protein
MHLATTPEDLDMISTKLKWFVIEDLSQICRDLGSILNLDLTMVFYLKNQVWYIDVQCDSGPEPRFTKLCNHSFLF